MQRTNRIPDFFVIGAPRCGTTAISKYLSNNPIDMIHSYHSRLLDRDLSHWR